MGGLVELSGEQGEEAEGGVRGCGNKWTSAERGQDEPGEGAGGVQGEEARAARGGVHEAKGGTREKHRERKTEREKCVRAETLRTDGDRRRQEKRVSKYGAPARGARIWGHRWWFLQPESDQR